MRHSIFFVAVVAATQMGCGAKLPSVKPFKMEIQQGNVVTSKMLLQLRPGMTRSQVRYIMGTPLVVDSFRSNRWDYFYELRKQGVVVEKRRVILDFDQDSLVSVRGDVVPTAENADVKTLAEVPKVVVDESKHWSEKLMFWKEDSAAELAKNTPNVTAVTPTQPTAPQPEAASGTSNETQVAEVAPASLPAPEVKPSSDAVVQTEQQAAAAVIADMQVEPSETSPIAIQPKEAQATTTNNMPDTPTAPSVAAVALPAQATTVAKVTPTEQMPAVPAMQPTAQTKSTITRPVETAKPTLYQAPREPAKATPQPINAAKSNVNQVPVPAPVAAADDDEIVPFIPEGEYQGPGPTLEEMQQGNAKELVTPVTEAATQTVTEKGVAPAGSPQDEPVFVAEQLPEPTPEPETQAPVTPPAVAAANLAREKAEKAKVELEKLAALKAELAKVEAAKAEKAEKAKAEALKANAEKMAMEKAAADRLAADQAKAQASSALAATPVAVAETKAPALNSESQLQADLAMWAQAWRSKKVASYLAAYASDFVPEGALTKTAWEAQRRQRLTSTAGEIRLVLKNVAVNLAGEQATVQFEQEYAAKSYSDKTNKTLQMRFDAGKGHWLIIRETSSPLTTTTANVVVPATTQPMAVLPATLAASAQNAMADPAGNAVPDVKLTVQAWAQAWARKDVAAYLAAYAPDFVPEGLPTRQAWVNQRKARLSPKQGPISVEISDVVVEVMDKQAKVQFHQKYSSKSYRDDMQKTLLLRLDAQSNAWLITKETATVETTKKAVIAPEGSAEQLDGVLEQIGF